MAACPPELTVDHIANVMTKHLVSTKSRVLPLVSSTVSNDNESIDLVISKHKFSGNSQSINSNSNNEQPNVLPRRDHQDNQRIRHLFNLWDKDKTQTLDVEELFMGFRKFQKAKHMDETMADVEGAIQAVQQQQQAQQQGNDGAILEVDNIITANQFEEIMAQFAIGVNVELHELIDFMYMQTVVHENHKEETDHHAMELQYAAHAAENRRISYTKSKSKRKFLINLFGLTSSKEDSNEELPTNSFSRSFNFGGSSSSTRNNRTGLQRSSSEGAHVQLSSRQLVNSEIRPSHSDSTNNKVKTVNLWASVKHHLNNLKQEEVPLPKEECPRTA